MIGNCPVLGVKLQTFLVDFMENMPVEFKGELFRFIKLVLKETDELNFSNVCISG